MNDRAASTALVAIFCLLGLLTVTPSCSGESSASDATSSGGPGDAALQEEAATSAPDGTAPSLGEDGGADGGVGCGPDVGGWTTFTPTPFASSSPLMDPKQPGSRIHYLSAATGDDATASVYFWDGARIVDASGSPTNAQGVAYGTDPLQPSNAVKPFKRWARVGPHRDPNEDIGSKSPGGSSMPGTRAGYPDWFLFRRGETFDLLDDVLSFVKEQDPSYAGDGSELGMSLSLSGGRSAMEPKIMGAYGELCAPRPRFIHPAGSGFVTILANDLDPLVSHIDYVSLHFDGHDRLPRGTYAGLTLLGQTPASVDIRAEDVWVDGVPSNIQNEAEVTLRRCIVTDAFGDGTSHVEGLFYYGTGPKARLRIEESIFLRNGFRYADPQTFTWPPSGKNSWDIYDRNLYLSGPVDPMNSTFVDSVSMIGTSGDQFRGGRRAERNFFYQGYVNMGGYNGAYAETPALPTGTFVDNVVQNFVSAGTDDDRGHPGWGLTLGGGAQHVEVSGNITTNAAVAHNGSHAFAFVPAMTDCVAGKTFLRGPNEGNHVHGNIFDSGQAASAIEIYEGSTDPCLEWKFPSTTGNTIDHNTLINAQLVEFIYSPEPVAASTSTDTVFNANALYATRASAASALGWPDSERTLKSYLASQGVAVTSADGFPEYFARAAAMRKGTWNPQWTARALVDYVRAGFAMAPLP